MTRQDSLKALGRRIREAREAKGWAAQALADRTGGLHRSSIRRIENGEFDQPSVSTLKRIGAALDLPDADLLSLAGYAVPDELPDFETYLRTRHEKLPEDAVRQITEHFDLIAEKYNLDTARPDEEVGS